MASGKVKTRYPRIYRTPAGTYEWMVERPRRRGEPRLPPITGTCRLLEGPEGARAAQTNAAAALGGGTYVDRAGAPTVTEQTRVWAAKMAPRWSVGTRIGIERMIRLYLDGTPLGDMLLPDAERDECQEWVDDLRARFAANSVRNQAGHMSSMFLDAMRTKHPVTRQYLIARNPMAEVDRPPAEATIVRADRVLTVEQMCQLEAAVSGAKRREWQSGFVTMLAGMGFRLGEGVGLRWPHDVDFPRRQITVESQLHIGQRKRAPLKTAWKKDGRGRKRVVPMPTWVANALAQHMENCPPLRSDDPDLDGLIFYRADDYGGRGARPYWHWGGDLSAAASRLHAADPTFPDVAAHDLRHHYVSLLIHKGLSPVAIGERIGDDPERVFDTYAHIWPGSEDDTRDAIDEAYGVTKAKTDQDHGDFRVTFPPLRGV